MKNIINFSMDTFVSTLISAQMKNSQSCFSQELLNFLKTLSIDQIKGFFVKINKNKAKSIFISSCIILPLFKINQKEKINIMEIFDLMKLLLLQYITLIQLNNREEYYEMFSLTWHQKFRHENLLFLAEILFFFQGINSQNQFLKLLNHKNFSYFIKLLFNQLFFEKGIILVIDNNFDYDISKYILSNILTVLISNKV